MNITFRYSVTLASLFAGVALWSAGCASTPPPSSGCATTRAADAAAPVSVPVAVVNPAPATPAVPALAPLETLPPALLAEGVVPGATGAAEGTKSGVAGDRLLGGAAADLAASAFVPTGDRLPVTSPAVTAPRPVGEAATAPVQHPPKERLLDPVFKGVIDSVHVEASVGVAYRWR